MRLGLIRSRRVWVRLHQEPDACRFDLVLDASGFDPNSDKLEHDLGSRGTQMRLGSPGTRRIFFPVQIEPRSRLGSDRIQIVSSLRR